MSTSAPSLANNQSAADSTSPTTATPTTTPATTHASTTLTVASTVKGAALAPVTSTTVELAGGFMALPDPAPTPGVADARVTQDNIQSTICKSGYSSSVRPSTTVTDKVKVTSMAS